MSNQVIITKRSQTHQLGVDPLDKWVHTRNGIPPNTGSINYYAVYILKQYVYAGKC